MSDRYARLHAAITARQALAETVMQSPWVMEIEGREKTFHVFRNGPAQILLDTAADLRVWARHLPTRDPEHFATIVCSACWNGVDGQLERFTWPCADYRDLESRYSEVSKDSDE